MSDLMKNASTAAALAALLMAAPACAEEEAADASDTDAPVQLASNETDAGDAGADEAADVAGDTTEEDAGPELTYWSDADCPFEIGLPGDASVNKSGDGITITYEEEGLTVNAACKAAAELPSLNEMAEAVSSSLTDALA